MKTNRARKQLVNKLADRLSERLTQDIEAFYRGDLGINLWVGSFRYFLGRMTIAVSCYCDQLVKNWPRLDERIQVVIKRELEQAFIEDDLARKQADRVLPLGHDCDRNSWEKVRTLWKEAK